MRAAFGGYLGKDMEQKADDWAKETPDRASLPEHVKKHALKGLHKAKPKAKDE
jgi:hypothetical protein